ncbi:MAG: mobile mystery protein A [Saprospiraceae bacterium]
MTRDQKHLRISQLDKKIAQFLRLKELLIPGGGWIYAIRTALGMSLKQLGEKLEITPQAVRAIEQREEDGSLTLQRLKEVAAALDMQVVYALVPKDESLEKMIEKHARQMAKEIVLKTSHTMHLENQGIDKEALTEAIERRTEKLKSELPKKLWD